MIIRVLLLGFLYFGYTVKADNDFVDNLVRDLFLGTTKHTESNEKVCGLVSSTLESLDSSDDLILLLEKFILSAKSHLSAIKKSSCEASKKEETSSRLVSNDVGNTNNSNTPSNCHEIKMANQLAKSGIYKIFPKYLSQPLNVYCDMNKTAGGGWTVIQRRADVKGNTKNFYRNWNDYKRGFGDLNGEFWIGNDAIFALTNESPLVLWVEMEDFEGTKRHATYTQFEVSSELNKYQLKIGGYYGDAGDSMSFQNEQQFYTFDRPGLNGCPKKYKGAWWYANCHASNLNGLYLRGNHSSYADGINWKSFRGFHYSLKKVEMKVRPLMY